MMKIIDAIQFGKSLLNQFDTAQLDSEVLLAHTLKTTRTKLYTYPEKNLSDDQTNDFKQYLHRRQQGEPIAYLTGHREFWLLDLLVESGILIPRPDTELLVEITLQQLPAEQSLVLADLGTGSGAIAIALAYERPHWQIVATDIYPEAIQLAKKNAARLNIKNIQFCISNWCAAFGKQTLDAIVANPPYIAKNDPHLAQGDVRFEPKSALIAGDDGLQAINIIANQARNCLKSNGILCLEHGYNQADNIKDLFFQLKYQSVTSYCDLNHHPRVITAKAK